MMEQHSAANDELSDELSAKFLQAAITSLRRDVVPHLADPSARIHADLITRVLLMLHSRFARRGEDLQNLLCDNRMLLDEIDKLVPERTSATPAANAAPAFSAIEKLERAVYRTELDVATGIPGLLDLAAGGSPQRSAAVNALRGIVESQERFLSAQDPDILKGSYVCYQGGRIDQEREFERPAIYGAEMTEGALTQHLQRAFPGSRVEKMSVMAGGFSKTTIFLTLTDAAGKSDSLVMRKDLPVDYISSVAYEFPLLQHLHKAGFAVAEPYWLEDDPRPFGGRFMLSRRVGGSTDFSRWAGDKQAVEDFARQLAKTMADLHAIKLQDLGYADDIANQSAGDLTLKEIDRWHDVLVTMRREREVYPIDEMAVAWLKANVPSTLFARRGCLAHGDIGFHNMMIDNGRVSALLDWEFSHPGDPIEDLVYTKPFIEKVMDWETFKGYYREYGGASCTAEEEFFYIVWSKTRNPISSVMGATLFAEAMPDNLKFAAACYILARYLSVEAGHMIVDRLAAQAPR